MMQDYPMYVLFQPEFSSKGFEKPYSAD